MTSGHLSVQIQSLPSAKHLSPPPDSSSSSSSSSRRLSKVCGSGQDPVCLQRRRASFESRQILSSLHYRAHPASLAACAMGDETDVSFLELLSLIEAQQRRPDVLLQVLQLLLQCSADAGLLHFLIRAFESPKPQQQQQQREVVVRGLRRLLRLIGGRDGRLSALATEVLINLTANEELTALLLEEYKDLPSVLLDNLKRQQQQQQRQQGQQGEDDVPIHLGVTLMLLSNVTRHKAAIKVLFAPDLPVPDFYLLPFVLLLHDAPRDPQAAFWKECGVFLLHILRNVTACDEAVDFLLTRRMRTVNNIIDLLRHMPPLCQAPFLTIMLRLACREQLHSLLLPTSPQQLQQEVAARCKQQQQQQQQQQPEEACRLLRALCCFLYPKAGSAQRAKAQAELATLDAEQQQQQQEQQQRQEEAAGQSGLTEKQRLRYLHPIVDVSSYGPSTDLKARSLAVDCLAALAVSTHGRETLRWFGVYEVLRAVFCIEVEEAIRHVDKVEEMVHVLVYTEEELQQQDERLSSKPQQQQQQQQQQLSC
ncbi:hypothetical protein Esti_005056 [Eimeria stiedai]